MFVEVHLRDSKNHLILNSEYIRTISQVNTENDKAVVELYSNNDNIETLLLEESYLDLCWLLRCAHK